jgi:hypothetical protein
MPRAAENQHYCSPYELVMKKIQEIRLQKKLNSQLMNDINKLMEEEVSERKVGDNFRVCKTEGGGLRSGWRKQGSQLLILDDYQMKAPSNGYFHHQ